MLRRLSTFIIFGFLYTLSWAQQPLISYVDPFIGTGGHGHTFPGAAVPFGMVQLSPDNGRAGWDWCSGYHYSDSLIAGFSHMHLSGTGIGDWLDISVMPLLVPLDDTTKTLKVPFSHDNEKASPGYYEVTLDNGIKAELTTTERCGYHRYTFPQGSTPTIRFDLAFHLNWDTPTETHISILNDSTLVGYRYSTGWAKVQRVYFAARTSASFTKTILNDGQSASDMVDMSETYDEGTGVTAQLLFDGGTSKSIDLKVALSMTSYEKALLALDEIQGWDFNAVRKSAEDKWENELKKVRIHSKNDELKRIFYTACYHTAMAPTLYSDADGAYQNANGDIHTMPNGASRYTLFSLWDTFRALKPLFTLTQREKYTDMLNSMLTFHDENGLLPVWDLSTWETNTMTGYHAIPVLADAILKDWPGLDAERAYQAMIRSAHQDIRGVPDYIEYGYLPQNKAGGSVTITLEYAYDDWCIAQVAKKLGKKADYTTFMERAKSYAQLFDKESGFMRAKNSDGDFVEPFDPYWSEHDFDKSQYIEGNAWQHSFFVPHDVRGLANLYGDDYKGLSNKLDELFSASSVMHGDNISPDASGFIGQYAHGNEPSHQIAYMYTYIGEAWKTQEKVRHILDSMYHDGPDGYAGNEDAGQMSAWAVWSIAGLYPVNPAAGEYVFGSPMADETIFALTDGQQFTIRALNNSEKNMYIQSATLNGEPYENTYIRHQDILNGGELVFKMGSRPNKRFGRKPETWPGN
ncbi:GH92 family glycosyl hydrolase [Parapedobacter tibetensis]|uniref:GH92 family glycosyl hydrolase n=1 Tax=Parapedobacter tibetensis TaxID=2972951 RepID=UPI00214D8B91|nr:GH92 family glycosyl hydrolase [Parapedobacter tibetensis]